MTQADALQKALVRFGAAVDGLERFIGQLFEDRDQAAKLKEQLRALTDERNRLAAERDRLAAELDHERGRQGALKMPTARSQAAWKL